MCMLDREAANALSAGTSGVNTARHPTREPWTHKQHRLSLLKGDNMSVRASNVHYAREENASGDRRQLAEDLRSLTTRLRQVDLDNLSRDEIRAVKDLVEELGAYFQRGRGKSAGQ